MVLKHNLRKLFKGNSRLMKITECIEDLDNRIAGGSGGGSGSMDLESELEPLLDQALAEETPLTGEPQDTQPETGQG